MRIWTCVLAISLLEIAPGFYSTKHQVSLASNYPPWRSSWMVSLLPQKIYHRGKSLLEIVGYHFSSRLTATLNLFPIYLKLLMHML